MAIDVSWVHGKPPKRSATTHRFVAQRKVDFQYGRLSPDLEQLAAISRSPRRDRELAFYGAEDLTPGGFYRREDAESAVAAAPTTVDRVRPFVPEPE